MKKHTVIFWALLCVALLGATAVSQTLVDSFSDGNFTANPVWTGDTGRWTVVTSSDVGAGASNSYTLRVNYTTAAGTEHLRTQLAEWGSAQEWCAWVGKRSPQFNSSNQGIVWLYANEANLEGSTVDGYRIVIGDDAAGDEILLQRVTNGAATTILTSSGAIATGLTDIGFIIRVTRTSAGEFTLYTSNLPTASSSGDVATGAPNFANVNQGSTTDNMYIPAANGYFGVMAVHATGTTAGVGVEFDQLYMTADPVHLILAGSTWKYLDNGSNQGTAWQSIGFDDAAWASGPARLGYGGDGEVTTVSYGADSENKYITTYFRKTFTVDDPALVTDLLLGVVRDDGAVVYLNGTEVFRSNMPTGTVAYNTLASAAVSAPGETSFFTTAVSSGLLQSGANVLAAEIHQNAVNSSDLGFDLGLAARELHTYTLTVNVVGSGSVSKSPDKSVYTSGEVVQLTATADPGYFFSTWSGDATGAISPTSVTMTSDKTVTATFLPEGDYALDFGGTNDYVDFGNPAALGLSTFTLETWFRRDATGTTTTTGSGGVTDAIPLIAKGGSGSDETPNNVNYLLGIRGADNVLCADFEEAVGSNTGLNHPVTGVTPIALSTWYHAAVTYDGSRWKLYLNGNWENAGAGDTLVGRTPAYEGTSSFALAVAKRYDNAISGHFSGAMDEVRVWNYARTQEQIIASINAQLSGAQTGLVGRWSLNEGTGAIAHGSAGTGINGPITNSGSTWITPGAPFNISFTTPDPPTALTATPLSYMQIKLDWTDNSDNESKFRIERSTTGSGGPFVRIDSVGANVTTYTNIGLTALTEYWYRVYAANAIGVSAATDPVAGTTLAEISYALDLNGTNTYVTFGNTPTLALAQFTLETWFKREGTGANTNTGTGGMSAIPLVTKGRGESEGSNVDMNYFLGIRSSDNVIAADFEEAVGGPGADGQNHPVYGTTPIVNDTWYHAAATFDGTSWNLYLNGTLEATLNTDGAQPRSDCIQHAGLGTAMNSTGVTEGYFAGVLDEVRIWNHARTQNEIQTSINSQISSPQSGLVGRWSLNDGVGTFVTGSAGTTVNGAITNAGYTWVTPGAPFNITFGPLISTSGTLTAFSTQPGVPSASQTYAVSGNYLTADITITAPTAFELSLDDATYTPTLTLNQTSGSVSSTPVHVRLSGATEGTFGGNIVHTSTDATPRNVAVTGAVLNVYTLTVTVVGTGCSVTKSPDTPPYSDGTVVTLTAVPAAGWEFYCWLGDLSGSENPTTITMSGDKSVTATFRQSQGWTAYNDCVYRAAEQYIGQNVTRYGIGSEFSGSTSGFLFKHTDSSSTGVTAALTQSGGVHWQPDVDGGGSDPNVGTDAYNTFHNIADMLGVVYYGSSGWYVDLTFTGLDPAKSYTFATSANRNGSTYATRISAFTIVGAESFTHASTSGVTITADTVKFCTGLNTTQGYVARWTDIRCGSDGSFYVRARSGSSTEYRAYAFSVFMLQEEGSVLPPAAPTALSATPTALGTHIGLTWADNSTDESLFSIERSTDGGSNWSVIKTLDVNATSYTDSGLAAGSTYHYRVRAGNGGVYSDYSNTASASISLSPDQPTVVAPLSGATGVATSPALQVSVTDPESDAMTVTFYGRPKISGDGEDFTLIKLPDTQFYTEQTSGGTLAMFTTQTEWIMAQKTARNIVFVSHQGDVTNNNTATEWERAVTAMSTLENPLPGMPYGIAIGNHDQYTATLFNNYFGPSRFEGRAYYGGHYGSDNNHNYQLFSGGGMDFIAIHLGGGDQTPATAVLDWADALLKTHSTRRGIVVNHSIIGTGDPATFSTPGQAIFNALKDNPNLFLMTCGHVHGEGKRTDTGDNGNAIHTILSDYQSDTGGNGWLRILTFSPSADQITVSSYSPHLSQSNWGVAPYTLDYPMEGAAAYTILGTNTGVASGTSTSFTWPSLTTLTEYEWYATVSDGHTTTTGATWSFTTGTESAPTDVITATQPNTDYASAETGVTLNFATLPAGGGEVTITRHNSVPPDPPTYELPPGSADYLPVWLEITSTIPDHSFAVEVTLDLSGVTGFDANSAVMFYNETSESWIPMAGTYTAGSPNTFTFTTTHFTPFGFVTKPAPSYDLFVGNTMDATSAGVKAPNNTWRSVTPPAGGYNGEDDWSWTGSQSITFYLVPQTSTIFKAADIMLAWDKSIMTYASTAFTGIPFTTSSATLQVSEDQLLIHAEGSADITANSYIAAITFTVLKPGHSPLVVIGSDFTKDPALSVFVTPHQGEVKAYLGDFATTTGPDYTQGDGKLDITDLSPWSSSYWSGVEGGPDLTNYKAKYDIGPTSNGYVYALPTLDTKIDFEDLVVFSISYGLSKQYQLPKAPVESKEPLMIASSATTGTGAETRIPVTVSGSVVDLRAMSLVLSGRFGKFLGAEKGALLQPYSTPVMLMSRTEGSRVYVDMAIMGSDVEALNAEGEVLVLRFDGKSTVGVTKADCRTSMNNAIAIEIKDAPVAIPTSFGLSQNYPNPFNPSTVLEYQVPAPAQVEISIYNLLGEKVATLVNEVKEPGYHSITWNGTGTNGQTVATGVYFYKMHAGDFVSTKRMLLVK